MTNSNIAKLMNKVCEIVGNDFSWDLLDDFSIRFFSKQRIIGGCSIEATENAIEQGREEQWVKHLAETFSHYILIFPIENKIGGVDGDTQRNRNVE